MSVCQKVPHTNNFNDAKEFFFLLETVITNVRKQRSTNCQVGPSGDFYFITEKTHKAKVRR